MTSPRSSLMPALLTAFLVLLLTVAADLILEHTHPVSLLPYLLDDLVMSILAGSLVWFYERRRLRELAKKLYIIAEMNHRVRNELEIIQYSAYATKEKQHMAMIAESVAKIEAALTQILEPRKQKPPRARSAGADQ